MQQRRGHDAKYGLRGLSRYAHCDRGLPPVNSHVTWVYFLLCYIGAIHNAGYISLPHHLFDGFSVHNSLQLATQKLQGVRLDHQQ